MEYIYEMAVYDFFAFVDDFKKLPPLFEIGRSFVMMPGDDGYKVVDENTKRKGLKGVSKVAKKAPDWFKRNAEKLKTLGDKGKPNAG